MLLTLVTLYLLTSIAMGLWFALRVKNTADYTVAGRALPMGVIVGTTFATWFGSETVIGNGWPPGGFRDAGWFGVVSQ